MGIVYEGWDDRLARPVAIKTILRASEPQMRDRFLREARAAAAVSHPHICQLFDIGEHEGEPFLCMELLDGRSLAERLSGGPMPVPEAATTQLAILSALAALHRRGIVHRDLKPTNIFLTGNGVKLLDFGLARTVASMALDETAVTMPGIVMGSPRYMSPEQVRGEDVDPRTDIFAAGLVLFEMLSGRAAFGGTSAVDVLHAVAHDHPPALMGSPAVVDMDRVIQRAVAKAREDRYQNADDMATEVRAALSRSGGAETARAHATKRLVVLPFKVLRPDPEVDFLAFSLPDAITASLSGLDSLTVRSSLAAARFSEGVLDLRAVASELSVEAAITGTLLHAGKNVRVAVQLVEVPSGYRPLVAHRASAARRSVHDPGFGVCRRRGCLRAEADPEGTRGAAPGRARQLGGVRTLPARQPAEHDLHAVGARARAVYASRGGRSVVCAGLGAARTRPAQHRQVHAHSGRAAPVPAGGGGFSARVRAQSRVAADAQPLHLHGSGDGPCTRRGPAAARPAQDALRTIPTFLPAWCRRAATSGMLDASVAAYHRATRLDPGIVTSVAHSFFMLGQYQRAAETDPDQPPYISMISHLALGQFAEAGALADAARAHSAGNMHVLLMMEVFDAIIRGRLAEGRTALEELTSYTGFSDPEGWYYWAQAAALLGDTTSAMDMLRKAVNTGFFCPRALESTPLLDHLRGQAEFSSLARPGP